VELGLRGADEGRGRGRRGARGAAGAGAAESWRPRSWQQPRPQRGGRCRGGRQQWKRAGATPSPGPPSCPPSRRRQVEAKKAVPKEETPAGGGGPGEPGAAAAGAPGAPGGPPPPTRKIFIGGLAPSVDEAALRGYFEAFGPVEDAVVMYDHDNKRPRGFGFVTFGADGSVEAVFERGAMQSLHDKQVGGGYGGGGRGGAGFGGGSGVLLV
jgi:hypothetical protein